MFIRQYYKAIAEIINKNTDEVDDEVHNHYMIVPRDTLITELADYFEQDNPQFDRQKFLKACGI